VTERAILICHDARGAQWQLGPLPPARGRLTLVGWTHPDADRDSGVPQDVAGVLARALTSVARVTFPSSRPGLPAAPAWSPFDGGLVRTLAGKHVVQRTVARLTGSPLGGSLISSRRPEVVTQSFDDPEFPWWLQGQALVMSAPDAEPPDLDEPTLTALFEDDWAARAARLQAVGVQGVMRPGVDGAIAGTLSLDDAFDRSFLDALEREARLAGMTWSIVREAEL
jgi:hypothetical protein